MSIIAWIAISRLVLGRESAACAALAEPIAISVTITTLEIMLLPFSAVAGMVISVQSSDRKAVLNCTLRERILVITVPVTNNKYIHNQS